MSTKMPGQLKTTQLKSLANGYHNDGGNLYLSVQNYSRNWVFRFKSPVSGKRREMGLGTLNDTPLAQARELAQQARKLIKEGFDPIEWRKNKRNEKSQKNILTFREAAEAYIKTQTPSWRNPKSAPIWRNTLTDYVYPTIGNIPVSDITTDHMQDILKPIWYTKTETAKRIRGRIENIIDYSIAHKWCKGTNPAIWKGHLIHILPNPSKTTPVKHFKALPWDNLPKVMSALTQQNGIATLAFQFLCLTVTRSSETRLAQWSEIDTEQQVWTLPANRTKAFREHRIPLSEAAINILVNINSLSNSPEDYIFPSIKSRKPLSDVALSKAFHRATDSLGIDRYTVHGIRSTFRDWCAEKTSYPREIAEQALSHVLKDKTGAAYLRSNLFDKRKDLMKDWAIFCKNGK
ncbi:tyrosine-type recombinase/integrase [Entomobacter blattae]|uniref:Prophage integrase IntA n=1 Tax=Entomobacter blattae TaxID=2762277 RepID=A0A7H1NS61_9PROT|nr:integrase arm-type DNA-binding domain-containing protein [Entomobacter blattae]QNT78621.1 Prophage integrase IntA [Entomobacter blattae]